MTLKALFLILAAASLSACMSGFKLPAATGVTAGADEVVLIGAVSLDPPIVPANEQIKHCTILGDGKIINTVFVATGAEPQPPHPSEHHKWKNVIVTAWDTPFMVTVPRQKTWIQAAAKMLNLVNGDKLLFPGGLYVNPPHNAQAIYIGTLKYHRNDFNDIVGIEVLDEYDHTIKQLGLGDDAAAIRKSLLRSSR